MKILEGSLSTLDLKGPKIFKDRWTSKDGKCCENSNAWLKRPKEKWWVLHNLINYKIDVFQCSMFSL
jgi:hypothetical protein